MYKLHFGPGHAWNKPSSEWLTVDIEDARGDIVLNFNDFKGLPLVDNSVSCIYGSHVFEHMSIFAAPKVFKECHRVLQNNGYLRIVLPDVRKSIEEYVKGNTEYPLFIRRREAYKRLMGIENVSLFELLKNDFLSPTGQKNILGEEALAHQNAWDFEALTYELERAGFNLDKIKRTSFQLTDCDDFSFEGTYPSEANEDYRSMYVEVQK